MQATVGLVDDQTLVRVALRRLLEGRFAVRWEAGDGRAAIAAYLAERVDVVLMDLIMPGKDGLDATKELKLHDENACVLLVTHHVKSDFVERAMLAGARGFVSKSARPEKLIASIDTLTNAGGILSTAKDRHRDSVLASLSDRELQVLMRIASGLTNREIASGLCISIKTVDSHRQRVLKKLRLRNNRDITRFAIRHGLISA